MKILVTGAAGFIGSEVCRLLIAEGAEVIGIDNINDYYSQELKRLRLKTLLGLPTGPYEYGQTYQGISGFRFLKLDIEDFDKLLALFKDEKFDRVIHLAAQAGVRYSIENPHAYLQSNLMGFGHILEACRQHPVEHLVYASSSSVYGANTNFPFKTTDQVDNPVSLYAASKKANELMAHSYSHLFQIPTTGLRYFTVYGPWGRPDMAPMLFANAVNEERAIKVFNHGNMQRDFTYVSDIAKGTIQVCKQAPHTNPQIDQSNNANPYYRIYNIGKGSPDKLLDFIEILEKEMGRTAPKNFLPMQDGDVPKTWADISDLEKEIGYKPAVSLPEGLKATVEWYKSLADVSITKF